MSSSRADFPADSVTEYVAALAAPTPAPAGGSAAAVTAAQGAALLAMAAAITVRRTSPMPAATDLTRAGDWAAAAAVRLLELAVADSNAFEALLAARRAARDRALDAAAAAQAGLTAAQSAVIDTPLAVCRTCIQLLDDAAALARHYRASVAPDAWAGVQLVVTGARISLDNARINAQMGGPAEDRTAALRAVAVTAAELTRAWDAVQVAFAFLHEDE